MSQIKKAWITEHDAGLVALSIESANPEADYTRITAVGMLFPAEPSSEHPLRHTVAIALLDEDDLRMIRDVINEYLPWDGLP